MDDLQKELACCSTFLEEMEILSRRGKMPVGFGTAAWADSVRCVWKRQDARELVASRKAICKDDNE